MFNLRTQNQLEDFILFRSMPFINYNISCKDAVYRRVLVFGIFTFIEKNAKVLWLGIVLFSIMDTVVI